MDKTSLVCFDLFHWKKKEDLKLKLWIWDTRVRHVKNLFWAETDTGLARIVKHKHSVGSKSALSNGYILALLLTVWDDKTIWELQTVPLVQQNTI